MTSTRARREHTAGHHIRSKVEHRIAQVGTLIFLCGSCGYLLSWACGYESNILVFLANVFAPAMLVILIGVSVTAELYALIVGKITPLRDIVVRYVMVLAVLVPTVAGELRSGLLSFERRDVAGSKSLTVLDVNLLGSANLSNEFYDDVERLNPDLITLQELNPTVAQRLIERVGDRYACQELDPKVGVYGMGILSKFPCTARDLTTFSPGIGVPQIVDVRVTESRRVSVINVHTIPPHTLVRNAQDENEIQQLSNAVVEREQFIQALVKKAREVPTEATILAGDMNATTRNRVYKIIRDLGFFDAWSAGPRLRGGTWPGPDFPLPSWIFRIDFIFHTKELIATHAQTLPHGYGSDHRGVFATLAMSPN
jgi:endonuclease/exonuclease/phosphatase (EEP) superfamily protein YafD